MPERNPASDHVLVSYQSDSERDRHEQFARLFSQIGLEGEELMSNLGLFVRRQSWARYLFMHELYKMALDVHGVVMEFGVRWGQNLALFEAFRGIYEPYNFSRSIVGFDTFSGFPSAAAEDISDHAAFRDQTDAVGALSVSAGWRAVLEEILEYHEAQSPLSQIRKFELVEGDVSHTVPEYLRAHPETVVALAYFDLDLYEPTRDVLTVLRPYLTKGSVLGFDEVCHAPWPGETVALREAFGIDQVRVQRLPFSPTTSFMIWEG